MERPPECVIIIGAPRSGTNMLRDILTRLPGLATWPCDELNHMWRYRNAACDHDELRPEHATQQVRNYIQRCFAREARRRKADSIVEKTCANSLRVAFVSRILPNAKFIWLIRDGRDAVASATKRWKAPLDLRYTIKKTRYVPLRDLPHNTMRYAVNRANRLLSTERRVATWGPSFKGMSRMARTSSLVETCATQWSRCVSLARDDFALMRPSSLTRVHYEDFVSRPQEKTAEILSFLGIDASKKTIANATERVRHTSIDNWKKELDDDTLRVVENVLGAELKTMGYTPRGWHGRSRCAA